MNCRGGLAPRRAISGTSVDDLDGGLRVMGAVGSLRCEAIRNQVKHHRHPDAMSANARTANTVGEIDPDMVVQLIGGETEILSLKVVAQRRAGCCRLRLVDLGSLERLHPRMMTIRKSPQESKTNHFSDQDIG